MTTISVEEIKQDVFGWLKRAEAGETIVILKGNKPMAEIIPLKKPNSELRPVGLCKGEFSVPDGFDAPLPDEIIHQFEGR